MKWIDFLNSLLRVFPFLEKWIDLQEKKLPMKIDEHNERKEVREIDAKWDAEKKNDKRRFKDAKRDKRIKKKAKKKNLELDEESN